MHSWYMLDTVMRFDRETRLSRAATIGHDRKCPEKRGTAFHGRLERFTRQTRGPRAGIGGARRIVVLALVLIVAVALAYLRFAPEAGPLSVPEGAKAGDLILESGRYETEDGDYRADVGTLVVPENRADPASRLIALPVVRIHARSDHPGEPIFRLEGGPGVSNMEFSLASRFADEHDVVLVGYRGVDGSTVLEAPEVESALGHSADLLEEESLRAYSNAFAAAVERYESAGIDLEGYTLTQQAEDIEAARVGLGYERIHLISESAGTRTAMIYSWRYPQHVYRSVMIGVNPPGNYLWDPRVNDEQIDRYAAQYAERMGASARTDDLAATMRSTAAEPPDRWLFLPIKKGNVRVASFMGMMESTTKAGPFAAPLVIDTWLAAAEGDASGLWLTSIVTDLLFPKMFVWGEYAAAGRIDAQAARDYFASADPDPAVNLGQAASTYLWGGGGLADAMPADPDEYEYRNARMSDTETLLVSGELDLSTPPQTAARQLLPYLPNGQQIVLPGIGHTGSFWNDQTEAGRRLVNAFFDTGRVDDSLYPPGVVDFTPRVTFPMVAKVLLGSMMGLGLLTVMSLASMARRLRRGRTYGRVGASFLRVAFPVVLGLGGWSLGTLAVATFLPGVALGDESIAALSVGLPVGLGAYLVWANGPWPRLGGAAVIAGSLGGAMVGAWLGFGSAEGPLCLLATLAGAAVGGNVILLALDVVSERRSDRPFTGTNRSRSASLSPEEETRTPNVLTA